jgi:hypothetical protein
MNESSTVIYAMGEDDLLVGPFSLDQLRRGLAAGKIDAATLVSREGDAEWVPVEVFLERVEAPPPVDNVRARRRPPPAVRAKASRAARFRSVMVPLGLLVLLGAGGGTYVATRSGLAQFAYAGRAASLRDASLNGEGRFAQLQDGRFLYPRGPLDSAAAQRRWHWLVTWGQGRVTNAVHVSPSGQVAETMLVEWKDGEARRVTVRNAYGAVEHTTELSPDGLATRVSRGDVPFWDSCAALRRTYDDAGHVATEECLDRQGGKVLRSDGCFGRRLSWSDAGAVSARACLSDDGAEVADGEGIHRRVFALDALGDVVEQSFLDATGARVARASDGCARVRTRRDDAGDVVEETCLDDAGSPRSRSGARHATTLSKHDANGCLSEVSFADAERRPTDDAHLVLTSDMHCSPLRREHRRPDGKLVGVILEDTINAEGDIAERRCSVKSAPAQCPHVGFYDLVDRGSLLRWEFNDRGQTVSKKCFRSDGTPSGCDGSYPHEERLTYDVDGQVSSESYFDARGEPAKWNGVHRQEIARNALGRLTSKRYVNVVGEPIHGSCGNAGFQITYDAKMRMLAVREVDREGRLKAPHCRSSLDGITWPMGAAQMEIRRGGAGTLTNEYTNSNGVKLKSVDCARPAAECYR